MNGQYSSSHSWKGLWGSDDGCAGLKLNVQSLAYHRHSLMRAPVGLPSSREMTGVFLLSRHRAAVRQSGLCMLLGCAQFSLHAALRCNVWDDLASHKQRLQSEDDNLFLDVSSHMLLWVTVYSPFDIMEPTDVCVHFCTTALFQRESTRFCNSVKLH